MASIIILAGLVVSVLIVNSQGDKIDERGVSAIITNTNDNPSFQFESGVLKPKTATTPAVLELDKKSSDNLTELLSQTFTENLLVSDQTSPLTEESVAQLLQEEVLQSLNYPLFYIKDIIVSINNSTENQIAYIESVDALLWKHFSKFENKGSITALAAFFQRNDPQLLNYLISATPSYLNDLLELEVPALWQESHIQMLNLWQEKLAIYQAVNNFQTDPLKAYVALQQLPSAIQKEQDIQLVINQFYEELIVEQQ